ncbi:MAG: sulfatase-like hydrolase/transferase [Firmicutes bacterium]|nr:sulfatase-like hydrolase/transferase [Bacillota bacterium]
MRILYIDIDTLRPDHMGCYGYARDTTPNLDKIAQDGVVFDNYYCSDAPCLPSRSALVSGKFGIRNGVVGHGGTAADRPLTGKTRDFQDLDERNNLFYQFRKVGLYTASISTFAERHSAWWFNAGFNETYNEGSGGMESGEAILPTALDWLTRNRNKTDWFLHLHLWDPHTPYRAPASFGNPFENVPLPDDWITDEILTAHLKKAGPHSARDIGGHADYTNPQYPRHPGSVKTLAEVKNFIDQYDCGIKYADYLLGQVIDLLKSQEIYEETAIIISSDHGENMGELGLYAEHATADHSTCNIPMIIKWQNGKKGRDSALRYNVDLLPTIAELLNLPISPDWDGKSYAGLITNGKTAGHDYLVLSQQAHVCQRSARFGDWLYIRTIRDGFQLFDDEMLFNIKDDSHELVNLASQNPAICATGAKIILDWQEEMLKKSARAVDPMWTVYHEGGPHHAHDLHLDAYLQRLEDSERADKAELLRKRYGRG